MTPRIRRLTTAVGGLIVLLFVGRWTAAFLAERWWALSISPAAGSFVATWRLLGVVIDAGAIVVASTWFALQALLVARVVASVQVTHRFGDIQLREVIPTRWLLLAGVTAGVLLGLIAGAGAPAWREPIALAWHGVSYGIKDPILSEDLGVYVAQLPAWELAHRFAALLAVLSLAFCAALYGGIGALRVEGRTLVLHPDARRHLGVLCSVLSLVIGAGYLLAPYEVAASAALALSSGAANARIHTAQIMAGVSLATALLSLVWALRGRSALLAASWLVLGFGATIAHFVVPELNSASIPTPRMLATAHAFDTLAWGIHAAAPLTGSDSIPSVTGIWDEEMLARIAEGSGGSIAAVTQTAIGNSGRTEPGWLVATAVPGDPSRLVVLAIADGVTTSGGGPIAATAESSDDSSRVPIWTTVVDPRTRPEASAWRETRPGVAVGGPFRRLALAWARQAPGMLRSASSREVDWHLDPTERTRAILPMFDWMPAEIILLNARPTWLVQGIVTIPALPFASRAFWGGRPVAGVLPAVLGTVDVASGETRFYSDPAADSLGRAWARLVGPLIMPASALPSGVRQVVPYDYAWFRAQVEVLQRAPWRPGHATAEPFPPVPAWVGRALPARQAILADSTPGEPQTIATAYRIGGIPELRLDRSSAEGMLAGNAVALRQAWSRTPVQLHLSDSLAAAGDSMHSGDTRWYVGGITTAAWRPVFAVPRRGTPTLLWIAAAIGDHIGGGRTPAAAWSSTNRPDQAAPDRGTDASVTLDLARQWIRRADSAFRRGDMTAFGRAYEELRRALGAGP